MIDKALAFILDRLNVALQHQYPSSEPHAVMADLGGPESAAFENKIILSVVNIERETGIQGAGNVRPDSTGYNRIFPPLNINLLILVAANYGDNYAEALKFLSSALAFFQSSLVLTPTTSSAFPAGLEKLTIEFVNMTLQELNSLWTMRGSLYLPSFLLKLRTLTISKGDLLGRAPAISSIDTE
jgi:Pvc16 N-terminal domain